MKCITSEITVLISSLMRGSMNTLSILVSFSATGAHSLIYVSSQRNFKYCKKVTEVQRTKTDSKVKLSDNFIDLRKVM